MDDPAEASIILNSDLQKISLWANKWLVDFNQKKTESLLISRKINRPIHPPLFRNEVQITEVSTHKHPGVTFSNDGNWHDHVEIIKSKAWQRIHIMRCLKYI